MGIFVPDIEAVGHSFDPYSFFKDQVHTEIKVTIMSELSLFVGFKEKPGTIVIVIKC